jgi:Fe-S-cluster containining protein
MHICKAVCCRMRFMLSAEEVDAGIVKWDIGHPYVIRHDSCGSCVHNDAETHGCEVYADRPRVCRQYDCTNDDRIWADFDNMVLNTEWIAEHIGARDISVAAAVPNMIPDPS